MPTLRERIQWHGHIMGCLLAYRSHYRNWRDWVQLLLCYTAHTAAGSVGIRNARWRVRLPGDPNPVDLRLGSTDFHALLEIFFADVYGFAVPSLKALPGGVRAVVDLGANAGYTVRLWSRLFPGCRVVAVEPDAENLKLCMANGMPAAPGAIQGVRCFVGGKAGVGFLDRSLGSWAYRLTTVIPDAGQEEPTPVRTVPEILSETPFADAQIDLLKCDIEKAKAEVFRGGPKWLLRVRAIVAEVHPPYTADALAADVRSAGGAWAVTSLGNVVLLVRASPG